MLCKNCGREIEDALPFCPYCGQKTASEDSAVPVEEDAYSQEDVNAIIREPVGDPIPVPSVTDETIPFTLPDDLPEVTEPSDEAAEETEEIEEELSPRERRAKEREEARALKQAEKERRMEEKEARAAAKARSRRARAERPRRKGVVGRIFLVLLLLAALGAGGYYAYLRWLSPEARYEAAMQNGAAAAESGDYESAVTCFDKAVSIFTTADAYIARGDAYVASGKVSNAIDDYTKAFFIQSDNAELSEKLGDAHFQEKAYENARDAYETAMKLRPSKALYGKLADTWLALGERDKALEVLRQGLDATADAALQSKYDALLGAKYEDYLEEGEKAQETEAALTAYSLAIALQPERTEAYAARAAVYAASGAYSDACSDYRQAIYLGDKTAEQYLAYADAAERLLAEGKGNRRELIGVLEEGFSATESDAILERLTAVSPSQPAGEYEATFRLELDSLCTLYYTLDGTDPTGDSAQYTKPISVEEGDTVIRILPVSAGGVEGSVVELRYNVTTPLMKDMAALEQSFAEHFNDADHEVFLYDVSGDELPDMIIVDKNTDDKTYRVRVYVYDGSVVTPVYNYSKATPENIFLCLYEGKWCLVTVSSEKEEDKRVDTWRLFTVLQDNATQEIKSFKETYEKDEKKSSELDGVTIRFVPLVGVPSLSVDAFGKFEAPENNFALSTDAAQYYEGFLYTNREALLELLPGARKLPVETERFVLADGNVYYYGTGEEDGKTLYCVPLTGTEATAKQLGTGDGETLVWSGGWLYVGENRRINAADGQVVTDAYPNVDKLVWFDGRYLFYQNKLSDTLTRSDRDLYNTMEVLAKYSQDDLVLTTDELLLVLKTGDEPTLTAYTLSGTYVYSVALDAKKVDGRCLVSGGKLFVLCEKGVAQVELATGEQTATFDVEGLGKDSALVAATPSALILSAGDEDGTLLVLSFADGTVRKTGASED